MAHPLAYFITFTCYGSHLPGAEPGSVDRERHIPGSRYVAPDLAQLAAARERMTAGPYSLGAFGRELVLRAIQEVCSHRGWILIAAHVRTSHVHVVVDATERPEAVMHDFKAYATRLLNQHERGVKRWTRHGSTRYLWREQEVNGAIHYVIEGQGEPMAVFPRWGKTAP